MGTDTSEIAPDLDDLRERMAGPLGLAFGACALGFIVGLAVPTSDGERRVLEPVREKLAEQASNLRR